jgi:hypothetical protein
MGRRYLINASNDGRDIHTHTVRAEISERQLNR